MGWKQSRWPLWVVAGIAAATAAVLCVVWWSPHRDDYATYGAFAVAVIIVFPPLIAWRRRKSSGLAAGLNSLDSAVEQLAGAVQEQWETAASERGLTGADPIQVTWAAPSLAVAGLGVAAISSQRFAPLPGLSPAVLADLESGCVRDLHALYGGLGSGRLIVVGAPGSGKSGTAVLLIVAALRYRQQATAEARKMIPVPVLVTAQDWDPGNEPVSSWLARQLRLTYPQLRLFADADAVHFLMAAGRIAVILDGLDEIDPRMQPVALRALSQQTSCRLVVLSRSADMALAAESQGLHGSAAIELQPVSSAEAASYLERVRIAPAPAAWRELIGHLRGNPASALSEVLDNPLALSLIRDTCQSEDDAFELLAFAAARDDAGDRAGSDVIDYLLDRVIPAAYTRQPGQPPLRYDLETAQRTLAKIAAQMNRQATRDLYWWQIPMWAPRTPRRIASALAFGLPCGLAFGLATLLAIGLKNGLGGMVSGSVDGPSTVITFVLTGGLVSGFETALESGLWNGLPQAVVLGIIAGLVVGLAGSIQGDGGRTPRSTVRFQFKKAFNWRALTIINGGGYWV